MNADSPPGGDARAALEAANGIRQFDRAMELLESALSGGRQFELTPDILRELNAVALDGIIPDPGAYRQGPITITNSEHRPPPADEVPAHIDEMCAYVRESWASSGPVHLAAYLMWRINWIHPFADGNGRTSRVVAYMVLCARAGHVLPGSTTVPAMITQAKRPYYEALEACDVAWRGGRLDISPMERLLARYLERQLRQGLDEARREDHA